MPITTSGFWEVPIQDRYSRAHYRRARSSSFAFCALLAAVRLASAQDVAGPSRAYRLKPSDATRAALVHVATTPLGKLALAAGDLNRNLYAVPAALTGAPPQLSDYSSYVRARALAGSLQPAEAAAEAERVINARNPVSPLAREAVVLAAQQYLVLGNTARAAALLRQHPEALRSPDAILALAQALEGIGDLAGAAGQYQSIYYEFPLKPEAAQAATSLDILRTMLGLNYPAPAPQSVVKRAAQLADAGQGRLAITELKSASEGFAPEWKAAALVTEGYAQSAVDRRGALTFWQALQLPRGDADAERLFHIAQTAHRLNDDATAFSAMQRLDRDYPNSPWRLEAGFYLADVLLIRNDTRYVGLYTSCYQANPKDARAAYCHWKVAWSNYLADRASGEKWFREHLERFPASDQAAAALYFLGRVAQDKSDPAAARAYFDAVGQRGASNYYAVLAREPLAKLASTQPAPAIRQWLDKIKFPSTAAPDFGTDQRTELRIARARLLTQAGLDNWAELEFRFGAQTDSKPGPLAIEWARLANERGDAHVGIRSIKAIASGYVNWTLDDAPAEFWKYAYPVPYADQVTSQAGARGVDWQVFAGLIRQESEFDTMALSRSHAMGLAQLMPTTGRQVGTQLGIRHFETSMLHKPEINLQLGAKYLGALFQSLDNRWEMALASYNAGKGRVTEWLKWADFREPAEFVETIPFRETRNYVKTVLRNSEIYRRLYATPPAVGSVVRSNK